jgi:hypothetical protein
MSRYFDKFRKEHKMTTRSGVSRKTDALLMNLAESIGSGLGALASKADAAKRALVERDIISRLEQEGKKFVRQTKKIAGFAKGTKSRSGVRSRSHQPTNRSSTSNATRGAKLGGRARRKANRKRAK